MKRLKTVEIGCYILSSQLFFTLTAHAYIDPSATTYVVQAVAGVIVAIGAGVGIYWRRAKRKMNEKLGIDMDKKKESESDEV